MKTPARALRSASLARGPDPLCGAAPRGGPEARRLVDAQLERIFAKKEFEAKKFGPSRWTRRRQGLHDARAVARRRRRRRTSSATTRPPERGASSSPAAALTPPPERKAPEIDDYAWSKDGKRLLVFTNTKKVWRRNTRGDYWVLDLAAAKAAEARRRRARSPRSCSPSSLPTERGSPTCAPTTSGSRTSPSGEITRLTSDGSATIVNGTSDWVYEEEFDLRDAFRWSPDGKSIAYWRFDSSGVGEFR